MKVLFVCQDADRVKPLIQAMRQQWPALDCPIAHRGSEGSQSSQEENPDLVMFYAVPAEADIYEAVEDIRIFSDVPIVVAAERWEDGDIAKALEFGADRYIRMPCSMEQIVARVVALLRRVGVA